MIVYHTGSEKQAVGLAVAVSDAYPDPKMPEPVTLAQVKADAVLKGTELARLPRLSVMPLGEAQFQRLLRLAGA